MKISEILATEFKMPLIWKLLAKMRNASRRVVWDAASGEKPDNLGLGTPEHLLGEVMEVRPEQRTIHIYAYGRNYVVKMREDDDDRYEIEHEPLSPGSVHPNPHPDYPNAGSFRIVNQ
jgi:hypothetical protein